MSQQAGHTPHGGHGGHGHGSGHGHGGHAHRHGDGGNGEPIDWTLQMDRLTAAARDDAEWYAEVADLLWRGEDRLVVDFACGGAGMARALRDRAEPHVRVVGVDRDAKMYEPIAAGLPGVAFATGSFEDDPKALREAIGGAPDLIWARHAVHHADNAQAAVDTLTAVLAPGGRLVLSEGGLTPRYLPYDLGIGEAGIEDGLWAVNHVRVTGFPHHVRMPHGWPVTLRRAGLRDVTARTVFTDRPAPLEGAHLDRALNVLARMVDWNREALAPEALAVWEQLLDPADEVWLGNREDLYHLEARTLHIGHKPR